MTVGELRELLKNVDDNRIVILASDSEGNYFSPLADVSDGMCYLQTTTWSGDIGLETLTESDIDAGYTEDDLVAGDAALVLYPTR